MRLGFKSHDRESRLLTTLYEFSPIPWDSEGAGAIVDPGNMMGWRARQFHSVSNADEASKRSYCSTRRPKCADAMQHTAGTHKLVLVEMVMRLALET